MKKAIFIACCATGMALLTGLFCFANDYLAPMFLNSRIERLSETGLPKAFIENGNIFHCRMKADDFRFPLPPDSHVVLPIAVTGGFDTVDGTVETAFDATNRMSASVYEQSLRGHVQEGTDISASSTSNGLEIRFHYFGDK